MQLTSNVKKMTALQNIIGIFVYYWSVTFFLNPKFSDGPAVAWTLPELYNAPKENQPIFTRGLSSSCQKKQNTQRDDTEARIFAVFYRVYTKSSSHRVALLGSSLQEVNQKGQAYLSNLVWQSFFTLFSKTIITLLTIFQSYTWV